MRFAKPKLRLKKYYDGGTPPQKVGYDQVAKSALSGASAGTMFGPWGTAAGAVVGAGVGLVTRGQQVKQYEKDLAAFEENKTAAMGTNAFMNYDVNRPTNSGGLGYFKRGGRIRMVQGGPPITPEYEAEEGEVITGQPMLEEGTQLASDVTEVGGNSHSQGGTDGAGGEFIFSDSLKISDNLRSFLGKRISNKDTTYADVAAKLGKQKGQYEKDGVISPLASKTDDAMIQKINSLMEMAAQDQEMQKAQQEQVTGGRMMKYGGPLKKMYAGGPPLKIFNPDEYFSDAVGYNPLMPNSPVQPVSPLYNVPTPPVTPVTPSNPLPAKTPTAKVVTEPRRYIDLSTEHPIVTTHSKNLDSFRPSDAPSFSLDPITGPEITESTSEASPFKRDLYKAGSKFDLNNPYVQADAGNLLNYAANLVDINKIQDYKRPNYVPYRSTRFFRDNRGEAAINNSFATMLRKGVNPNMLSSLYGSSIRGKGDAVTQQNLLETSVRNSNAEAANRVSAINTGLDNQFQDRKTDVFNKKVSDRLAARNTFVGGLMTNRMGQRQEDAQRERIRMMIEADPTGASADFLRRFLQTNDVSAFTKKQYGK